MISNTSLLRIGSLTAAVLLALSGLLYYNIYQLQRYRRQLEFSYIQSIQELSGQLNSITMDLYKSQYAGTPAQISAISAKVWREATAAKSAVSHLPTQSLEIGYANQFLSQVGEYSMYLSRKALRGEEITVEEQQNFKKLTAYASGLNKQLADIEYSLSSGQVDLDTLLYPSTKAYNENTISSAVPVSLTTEDQTPETYPTLLYDGPFSDHIMQHSPTLTQNQPQISWEKAAEIASEYTGLPKERFVLAGEEASRMPSYDLTTGPVSIGVTKAGGYVTYILSGREIGAKTISVDRARRLARSWLEYRNLGPLKESYYQLANGVLTINYAHTQGDVVCYTDLIKVGIAMDSGDLVFYDARGYINNHKQRELADPTLSVEQALGSLSPNLTPEKVQLALIPTPGNNEVLTYEFWCRGIENEDVLVYVNAHTGVEEQILILLIDENGALAM